MGIDDGSERRGTMDGELLPDCSGVHSGLLSPWYTHVPEAPSKAIFLGTHQILFAEDQSSINSQTGKDEGDPG